MDFVDSEGERKIPSILSESLLVTNGMLFKERGGARRADPIGRIAHLSRFGCSLETSEKVSMQVRISFKASSFSP